MSADMRINSLLEDVDQNEGLGLVAVIDQVLKLLEESGQMWTQQIRPQQVAPDPENRDGVGVNAEDVHGLGADILAMGFSWIQVSTAVCIEESPGAQTICDFNKELASGSDNLPNTGLDQIRFGSIACSHTNMFLRCLTAGVASTDKDLSEGGHLSLEKVSRRDLEFARAAREGLCWSVLSHKVRSAHPKLLSLIQRARNAPQAVARAEHEVQVMLRMHRMAAAQQRKTSQIDWEAIRRIVAQSIPPCGNYLPEISVFIAMCGGGVDGGFLKDLASYHRQFVDSRRCTIRGPFLLAIAEAAVEAPFLKIAIMKAQSASPPKKINKYCDPVLITPTDLSKLLKNSKQMALDANKLLSSLRDTFGAAGLDQMPHSIRTKLCGRLDTMVVRFLLDKQASSKLVLTSLQHTARVILQEAQSLTGWTRPSVLCEALDTYPETKDSTTQANAPKRGRTAEVSTPSVTRMQEYTGGQLTDALAKIREHGLDIGCRVIMDSSEYAVSDASDDVVSVTKLDNNATVVVTAADFLEKCQLRELSSEDNPLLPGWPLDYLASKTYLTYLAKQRIQHALHLAASTTGSGFDLVDIYEKPKRTVRAKTRISKGALVLVPNCTKVVEKMASDQAWEGEITVSTPSGGEFACLAGVRFVLSNTFSKELPIPAWAVRPTADDRRTNMAWTWIKVTDVGVAEGLPARSRPMDAPGDKAASTSLPAASPPSSASSVREFSMEVPALINTRSLEALEELFVHRAAPQQAKRPQATPVKLTKIMRSK